MSTEYLIPENFLSEIETFLTKDKKSISQKRYNKYVSPEFKEWLELKNIPPKFLLYIYNNHLSKITVPICPNCGKELSFNQMMSGGIFCSIKCLNSSQYHKEKIKETNLKKYGVSHSLQAKEVRDKII